MQIITDCSVHLLSEPLFHPHPKYLLPLDGTPAERLIATGGKVCYDTYGSGGNPVVKHVESLVSQAHFSVTEHAHVGVFIEGISRGCSHELVRHRCFNYSQRSTRYTDEADAAIVLEPFMALLYQSYNKQREPTDNAVSVQEYRLVADFLTDAQGALQAYETQLKGLSLLAPPGLTTRDARKWCRGKARQLLPHALETRLVMTGNLLSWRQFFLKRTSRHAEPEIRRLASKIFNIVQPIAPAAFNSLKVDFVDGFPEVTE